MKKPNTIWLIHQIKLKVLTGRKNGFRQKVLKIQANDNQTEISATLARF